MTEIKPGWLGQHQRDECHIITGHTGLEQGLSLAGAGSDGFYEHPAGG